MDATGVARGVGGAGQEGLQGEAGTEGDKGAGDRSCGGEGGDAAGKEAGGEGDAETGELEATAPNGARLLTDWFPVLGAVMARPISGTVTTAGDSSIAGAGGSS